MKITKAQQNARARAMRRVIKSATRDKNHPCLWGSWRDHGRQYVCDGFRLVMLFTPADLPSTPHDTEPIDAERILEPARMNNGARLILPDAATVRAYINAEKQAHAGQRPAYKPLWDFGDGLPWVNAQYLLDMIETFPDAIATCRAEKPLISAIYFRSDDGDGVLLPVRKK